MAVPVISDLPSAPTRNDGAADFTTKADAMIDALQPLVVQINIATQWMNGTLSAAQAAQADAAAGSAATATAMAQAAGAAVGPPPVPNKFLGTDSTGNPAWRDAGQKIGDACSSRAHLMPCTCRSTAACIPKRPTQRCSGSSA